ncbi:bacillithiol biosynthesis cysteine-adding enzyme BshC [Virgibacillus alimentarius]|uniref:bacillithiol biosynthesis cysteine-adding enzyme BshC n=1 Tax=Virgibacillus alimentarius TaxID=698769 RepID=UPI0004936840|nr:MULTISPECIES: bacillithiol biosynthesis cysteine-adding enzyme BshC [Virgibacillus]HLR66051.1 bacillithiol biosynthesis cysteine-adding enzyme BshC [Virgibacillus sp.]
MRIDPMQLNQSKLIHDYRNNTGTIRNHFDYPPFQNYEQRVKDLKSRSFNREHLINVLHTINQQWDAPDTTHHNIERLNNEESVVVIGGQQAGLLTGPLYTINKIISIIQFAKQQEEHLNIPVIPVFWIAGEDHDFDEINHVYLPDKTEMKKHKLRQRTKEKRSISTIDLDKEEATKWINQLFVQLQETAYTKDLYTAVKDCLYLSKTYVDFFARVIYQIFNQEGLVLIDSGHPKVRHLETEHFVELIHKQSEITSGVYTAYQQLKQEGYSLPLDLGPHDAHLFYHQNQERVLLTRNENGAWRGKQDEVELTTEELLNVAKNTPDLLSNNVVTRPIMQELLFPTLAFIGGNGEISYWSVLKPAFRAVNLKMPPVLPRLSFTFIDKSVSKLLAKYEISDTRVIESGIDDLKQNWLEAKQSPPIEQMADEIKLEIEKVHLPLRNVAQEMQSDLGELAAKNLYYLQANVDYLKKRMVNVLEAKYAQELAEFDRLHNTLHPSGGLQERIWNLLPLWNKCGVYFIKQLTGEACSFEKEHFIIHI